MVKNRVHAVDQESFHVKSRRVARTPYHLTLFATVPWLALRQLPSAGDEAPPEWHGDVTYAILSTPFLTEIGFVLPKYKILTVADNALMIAEPDYQEKDRAGAEKLGVWNRLGPINKPLMERYPEVWDCTHGARPIAYTTFVV